ncbi:MAG: sugar-binding domain-containing protein, partial [Desulfarculaceae bacterium]
DHLRQGQTLGLGWGKTLRAAINYIPQRSQSGISVVSLFGGLPRSVTTNPYDIASAVARRVDASECYYIAAPMFVSSRQVRDTLMSQELFSRVFERAAQVDLALVGAGDLTAKATNVVLGALTPEEWKSLLAAGAVGELFGYFLDAQGNLVDHSLNQRIMGPNWQDMLNIPFIAMAAGGLQKVPILRAVLNQGFIHMLITDELTAREVLDGHDQA